MKYDSRGFYYSSLFEKDPVFACFGTRITGDAKNLQTAESLLQQVGVRADRIVRPIQTHSITVVNADSIVEDRPDATDGVTTSTPGVALTVITADCVPVIFMNTQSSEIGISHQGWRGLHGNMPREMVRALSKGGGADSIVTAIGPSIGSCCYEISAELYSDFTTKYSRLGTSFLHIRGDKHFLSLNNLCYLQLLEAGIAKDHIDFFPFCTKCDSNRFFSYRRDGDHDKNRMLSIIVTKNSQ